MKKLFLIISFFLAMALSFGLRAIVSNPLDDWAASDQWELESDDESEEAKPLELSDVMLGSDEESMKASDFLRSLDDVDVQPFRDLAQPTGDPKAEIIRTILAGKFGRAEVQPFVFDNLGIPFNEGERVRENKLNKKSVEKQNKINDSLEKERKKKLSIREKVKLDMKVDKRNIDLVFLPKEIDNLRADAMAREIGEKKSNDPEFVTLRNGMLGGINKGYNLLVEQLLGDLRGRAKSLRETYKKNVEAATKRLKNGLGIKWYSLPKKRKKFNAAVKEEAVRLRAKMNEQVGEMVSSVKTDMMALNDARVRKLDVIRDKVHNSGLAREFSLVLNKMSIAEADMVRKKFATGGRDSVFDSIGNATELHAQLRKATPERNTGFNQTLRKHESQRFLALFLKFREKDRKVKEEGAEKIIWSPNEKAEIQRLFLSLRENKDAIFKEMAGYDDKKDTFKKLLNKFHESSGVGESTLLKDLGAKRVASNVIAAIKATSDDPDLDINAVSRTISQQAQTLAGRKKLENILEKAKRAKSRKDDATVKDLLSSLITGETGSRSFGARGSKEIPAKTQDVIDALIDLQEKIYERTPGYDESGAELEPIDFEEMREMYEKQGKQKSGPGQLKRELVDIKKWDEKDRAERFNQMRKGVRSPKYQAGPLQLEDVDLFDKITPWRQPKASGWYYASPNAGRPVRPVRQQPVHRGGMSR